VRADGSKELVALNAGYRESAGSWADLHRDCARRGMRAPVLAVGDGALDFWKAPGRGVPRHPRTRWWVHKTVNVLDTMPKSAQPGAKKAIPDIYNAEDDQHAHTAIKTFAQLYGVRFPKAVKKIIDDEAELLAFFDFPAEHWIRLRTTNTIESTFATVRLRTKVTRAAPAPAPRSSRRSSISSSRPCSGGVPSTHPTSWPSSDPAPAWNAVISSSAPSSVRPEPHQLIYSS
jgi:transposase-like protein